MEDNFSMDQDGGWGVDDLGMMQAHHWWLSGQESACNAGDTGLILGREYPHKLKKIGKITRPFRYDLNQIPYDYTVEVRNRFKGLYLIE